MGCKTCGSSSMSVATNANSISGGTRSQGSTSSCGCKSDCYGGTSNWLIPVVVAPPIELASRKYAYITPDDKVWVLSYDESKMVELKPDVQPQLVDAFEALPELKDADPLKIYRQDDKLVIINNAKTEWLEIK